MQLAVRNPTVQGGGHALAPATRATAWGGTKIPAPESDELPLAGHKDEVVHIVTGELDPNPTIAEDWDYTEVQKEISRYQGCL